MATPARYLSALLLAVAMMVLSGCSLQRGSAVGTLLRDCAVCPQMVLIPGGELRLEDGKRLAVDGPFALGRHEVTQAEFAAFVSMSGYRPGGSCEIWDGNWYRSASADWASPGRGRTPFADEPVVCVSWHDAEAYVDWLSRHTGRRYRLPTADEWELAARAGDPAIDLAGDCEEQAGAAAPGATGCTDEPGAVTAVGSFAANAFGLHDMVGNVGEWSADCWHGPPSGTDGSRMVAEAGAACTQRSVHGGSRMKSPEERHEALSEPRTADARYAFIGFRVAGDL